jgi:hypothetical protein
MATTYCQKDVLMAQNAHGHTGIISNRDHKIQAGTCIQVVLAGSIAGAMAAGTCAREAYLGKAIFLVSKKSLRPFSTTSSCSSIEQVTQLK